MIREAYEGGVKVTVLGETPDGIPITADYAAKYDGKDVSVDRKPSVRYHFD